MLLLVKPKPGSGASRRQVRKNMPGTFDEDYPPKYESLLTLKDGRQVFLRPIRKTDGNLLIDLFNKMSPQSLYLRFLWRIDALSAEMIHHFTHLNYSSDFALVAVAQEDARDAIIAVGRYFFDSKDGISDLAVAVRDDWQRLGLGKSLLAKTVAIGKEHGFSHFKSMMDIQNKTMRRLLLELGYEVKYSLRSGFYEVDIRV